MFEWLKKICKVDKADSISDKEIFEEDKSLCKAKVDNGVLIMKDTECVLISELKQNQKFIEALRNELHILQKECECKNISNLIKILNNVNYRSITGDNLLYRENSTVAKCEVNRMVDLIFVNVDIPDLIKELELIESSNKIIQEYQNNILEVEKRINELKKELGIEGI